MNRIFDEQEAVTLKRVVDRFGETSQLIVAVEECSELQKEITKYLRGKRHPKDIAEEIADVLIMIGQLQVIYPDVTDELIDFHINKKLNHINALCHEADELEKIICLDDRY